MSPQNGRLTKRDFRTQVDGVFLVATEMEWTGLLERFIAWLATQYEGPGFHLIAHHFDLSGYRRQLRDAVEAGRICELEARHSYFIAALSRARKMSHVVLDNNVAAAKIRHLYAKLKRSETSGEIEMRDIDENELRFAGLRKQTDKWRELSA